MIRELDFCKVADEHEIRVNYILKPIIMRMKSFNQARTIQGSKLRNLLIIKLEQFK